MGLPAIIYVFVFKYLTLTGIAIAFQNYRAVDGIFKSQFVALKNFEFLFRTSQVWIALRNTLVYNFLFIVFSTICSLLLAFLIYEIYTSVATRFYQTTLFFPQFISWVIVSYFLITFLNSDGLINKLLASLGLDPVRWYTTTTYWPAIFVLLVLWKGVGSGSLLYLAAMLGIDPQFYEAARIDGANKWQEFRHITLPFLMPIMIIMLLLSIGGIFQSDFGLFYVATRLESQPSLLPVAETVDTLVYRSLIKVGNVGMSGAAGLFQAVMGFLLVIISNWIVRKIDPERSLF
jgi:putative aldouronate transport system permease protein